MKHPSWGASGILIPRNHGRRNYRDSGHHMNFRMHSNVGEDSNGGDEDSNDVRYVLGSYMLFYFCEALCAIYDNRGGDGGGDVRKEFPSYESPPVRWSMVFIRASYVRLWLMELGQIH
jgi:hypothetical protein